MKTPSRGALIAGSAAIVLLLFVSAAFSGALTSLATCGGDGGSPYAAPASPRGEYCDSGLPAFGIVGGLVLGIVGAAVAISRGRWQPVLGCGLAGAVLIVSPIVLGSVLSKDCSDRPSSMTADEFQRYHDRRPECGRY